MTGWLVALALYFIGLVYFVVEDRHQWKRQGIPWTWRNITRNQLAWPLMMLSGTIERLRR